MEEKGLTSLEVEKSLAKYGYNQIIDLNKLSWLKILFRQIKGNFIFFLLFTAMIISFFVGKLLTGYVILVVILVVVSTGFIQEFKAEKAIESLKRLVTPFSIVVRNGKEMEISSKEIVPGDLLILRNGEKIPADCLVLEEKDLLLDESILTGESKEVKKIVANSMNNLLDENLIFAGSFILGGKCIAKVLKTGMNTKFGHIASLISSSEKDLPLQKKVNKLTKKMAFLGMFIAFLTGLAVLLNTGFSSESLIEVLILTIAISVSAFPEGFPVVLIVALSSGAYRMAKRNAIVNRMSIIETLGETTVICSDKTGTITKGEMTVKRIFSGMKNFEVSGVGYESKGDILFEGRKVNLEREPVLNLMLKTGILCNDSSLQRVENKKYQVLGSPTEAALLILGTKVGMYKEDFSMKRDEELIFTSERKMMSVVLRDKKDYIVYSKGALEILLDKCKYIQTDSGVFRLLEKDRKKILDNFRKMNSDSLRTLGLAYKNLKKVEKDSLEKDLIFLGMIGMQDPPREEVKNSIIDCRNAGISVKLITGDSKEIAVSIAKEIGLDEGRVMLGSELDSIKDRDLFKLVRETVVFARVKPEHKLRIVKALKENGEIVTMTGDGVNDSPALKEAHIGVAMGKSGTDVSRSVADLTLKDDNFATIVDAVKEGRTIFNNIRKFAAHQFSCNLAELTILFVGVLLSPLLGWPVPLLLALHILFMNLFTDNLPTITLALNSSSLDIMNSKPRKDAKIFSKNIFCLFVFAAILTATFTLLVFWFTFSVLGQSVADARTTTLVALIMLEIAGAFVFRSFRKGVFNRSPFVNKYLFIASSISLLATVLIVYSPINVTFETVPLPFIDWLVALGFSLVFIGIFDVLKRINNRKNLVNFDE